MAQLISKVIFKYIVLLLLTFASSVMVMVGVHLYFQNLTQKLEQTTHNLQAKIDIARYTLEEISNVHVAFLELTVSTRSKLSREGKIQEIRSLIHETEKHIAVLNYGGVFEKKLSPSDPAQLSLTYTPTNASTPLDVELVSIFATIDTISRLLNFRDTYIETNNPNLSTLVLEIRGFNANVFLLFSDIEAKINALIYDEHTKLEALKAQNVREHQYYNLLETLLLLLSAVAIVFVIHKIVGQIINLYKELENQLYIDALTKLKNRSALLRDISEAKHPCVIVIDITMFRTINELYGVDVGNEVLRSFATSLKVFAKNHDCQVYRISGDEFVFFKDNTQIQLDYYTQFIETFFHTMSHKSICVSSLEDTIYLEMSAGISFDKLNPLGTADIALNHAKALHKNYIIYHSTLDSIGEIKQGALWKKKIIHGIEDNRFIPFFQPIVNREEKIIKYEALMRLAPTDEMTECIPPYAFLDIAIKTHHYDQISQMTLMKSLQASAEKGMNVSLNLNFQDILNKPLHKMMKEFILQNTIGHKVVFEIVESQNIQDYALLKQFMEEFRGIGVRFAIDDFGTGFSNFTHILEFSPDFVKIDGSLIKHLDTDKKSYELVKAIVFFSKEIGIQTVAEFVHSKEVFEVALSLGIDQFQGYYFGMPSQEI